MHKRKIMVLSIVFFAAVMLWFFWMIYFGPAMQASKAFVRSSPEIIDMVGVVRDIRGGFACCRLKTIGPSGWAKYELSVSGKKGNALVLLSLDKELGSWRVTSAKVRTPSGEIISLTIDGFQGGPSL